MIQKNTSSIPIIKNAAYGIVLLAITALIFAYHSTLFTQISSHLWLVALTTFLSILAMINQSLGYRALVDKSKKIPIVQLNRVWAISSLSNYLGPFQPGLAVRSGLLKAYSVSWKSSFAASIIWAIFNALVGSALLLILFLIYIPPTKIRYTTMLLAILAAIVITLATARCVPSIRTRLRAISRYQIPYTLLLFISLQYTILILTYVLLYAILSPSTPQAVPLIVATSIPLVTIISVTPNGVGVIEGMIMAAGALEDIPNEINVMIIVVSRASHILSCLFIIFYSTLTKRSV